MLSSVSLSFFSSSSFDLQLREALLELDRRAPAALDGLLVLLFEPLLAQLLLALQVRHLLRHALGGALERAFEYADLFVALRDHSIPRGELVLIALHGLRVRPRVLIVLLLPLEVEAIDRLAQARDLVREAPLLGLRLLHVVGVGPFEELELLAEAHVGAEQVPWRAIARSIRCTLSSSAVIENVVSVSTSRNSPRRMLFRVSRSATRPDTEEFFALSSACWSICNEVRALAASFSSVSAAPIIALIALFEPTMSARAVTIPSWSRA